MDGVTSNRAAKLKENLLGSPYEIDIERARFYTKSWRRTEDAEPCMRAARALEETLRSVSLRIDPDERLVGAWTVKPLANPIPVERGEFNTVLELELDRLLKRNRRPFHIEEDERRELERDILPYWRNRTVRDRKIELWKREGIYEPQRLGPRSLRRIVRGMGWRNAGKIAWLTIGKSVRNIPRIPRMQKELAGVRPNLALTVFDVQGHLVPGYRRVLELGFNGIASLARGQLAGLQSAVDGDGRDYERQKDFLESVMASAGAVCEFADRYAELARKTAAEHREGDQCAEELLRIAERCERVPAEPARTFMEALQSLWMTQVALSISYGMAGILSIGRVDQYLYPYYEADVAAGRITRQEALEAVEEYLVKLAAELIMLIETGRESASEMGVGSNTITIGGLDSEGNDATNEVSHLFLEAYGGLRSLANNLCVRISPATPRDFLVKACENYRQTSGLALFNDEVIIAEMVEDGYELADARDYSIVGCVEPTSTGKCFSCTAGNDISLAGVLEMALNEGRMLFSGKRVGAETGDPARFESFEDVKSAFVRQLSFNVAKLVGAVELLDQAYADGYPSPLLASTLDGCVESGMDLTWGGARYNFGSVTGRGLGTVVDSLAAVRWAVFERGMLTIEELVRLLCTNFRGAEGERIRQELVRRAPKYGNDDEEIDELAAWVTRVFSDEVKKHQCGRGGFYRPGIFSYGVHVLDGMYLGATPDGRRAGEPVSNGISPVNGTERAGPTAVLRSAARAGGSRLSDGTALNMRLSPALIESDESLEKLASLILGYFEMGGRHVQFNVVDTATLKDAQAHPENYPDLVVRVSGYCAYFTDLGRSIQEDIIARTQFGEL